MFEVYKGVAGPKCGPQFIPGNDLTRPPEQDRQNLKWLLLKTNPLAALAQLPGRQVGLENSEADNARRGRVWRLRRDQLHLWNSGKSILTPLVNLAAMPSALPAALIHSPSETYRVTNILLPVH